MIEQAHKLRGFFCAKGKANVLCLSSRGSNEPLLAGLVADSINAVFIRFVEEKFLACHTWPQAVLCSGATSIGFKTTEVYPIHAIRGTDWPTLPLAEYSSDTST
jgi:hypothetical protein